MFRSVSFFVLLFTALAISSGCSTKKPISGSPPGGGGTGKLEDPELNKDAKGNIREPGVSEERLAQAVDELRKEIAKNYTGIDEARLQAALDQFAEDLRKSPGLVTDERLAQVIDSVKVELAKQITEDLLKKLLERKMTFLKNWQTASPSEFDVEGTSAERAYNLLGLNTEAENIIVAVIDSGVDIDHEDLQGQIWTNEKEIAGNGIDDDNNGYIDDIHGWNYLGSYDKDGKPVHLEKISLEMTRELGRMQKLKKQKEDAGEELLEAEAAYLAKVDAAIEKEAGDYMRLNTKTQTFLTVAEQLYNDVFKDLVEVDFDGLTKAIVDAIESEDAAVLKAKEDFAKASEATADKLLSGPYVDVARAKRVLNIVGDILKYRYDPTYDPRAELIGDDIYDMDSGKDENGKMYGNNDVKGPVGEHGTHVSGIIGAVRDNDLGIKGIATNVKIMVLRAVPDGDELDKDVAHAVRYAADNGARIINMSFGKSFNSPLYSAVDEAMRYAVSKGVLLVHAAGNDAQDNDVGDNFPTRTWSEEKEMVDGWLEVGASAALKGSDLVASFSNYGKHSVDLFAPGYKVPSTIPGNQYAAFSGTSMASPAVAGVAALVLSQYPELSPVELKELLMSTVRTDYGMVKQPFEGEERPMIAFEDLSVTGGIVDAYRGLLKLALGL